MPRFTFAVTALLAFHAQGKTLRNLEGEQPDPPEFQEATGRQDVGPRSLQTVFQQMPEPSTTVCEDPGFMPNWDENTMSIMGTLYQYDMVMQGLMQYQEEGLTVGSSTANIAEANAPSVNGIELVDGQSGDVNFPHGNLKPIATMGERSVCPESYGQKLAGPADGVGAYLPHDDIVRVVYQSEAYGPLGEASYPVPVNGGAATFGGSYVHYVDYLREPFSTFMEDDVPASTMVTGMGQLIQNVINLKGEPVGHRNGKGNTTVGAHFTNTDENGMYIVQKFPREADWFIMSLCSAYLDLHEQWGEGIGLVDDIFMTNEEWISYGYEKDFVGLSAHALDVHTRTLYAVGAFAMGGFEKILEINPQSPNHIIYAISGYNGNYETNIEAKDEYEVPDWVTAKRNEEYGNRTDGKPYVWTKDTNPMRIYVGVKGLMEDGSEAPEDDFLARNGLRYGNMYGFSIDMTEDGPTGGVWRDEWHKSAVNGDMVTGKWLPQPWRWDGTPRNFEHDGAWDYQNPPTGANEGEEFEGYFWWSSAGPDGPGCKTEHIAPDPRIGITGFIQGSTCGYFGHNYILGVEEALAAVEGAELPSSFDGEYYVYQGETDVVEQIELGGAGQYTEGRDARFNWDSSGMESGGKRTFEDIDGLMVFEGPNEELHVILQEDSTSILGDRMVISSALEHEKDDKNLTYYFIAFSGGAENPKTMAGVGVPANVICFDGAEYETNAHEFSGGFDLSGFLAKDEDGEFMMKAGDPGSVKHAADRTVSINDKNIIMSLQAHDHVCGVVKAFQASEGGQWVMYKPAIPTDVIVSKSDP